MVHAGRGEVGMRWQFFGGRGWSDDARRIAKWMHSNTSTWKRRKERVKLSALIIDLGYQNWHLVLVLLFL